jgi:hypothetical protein
MGDSFPADLRYHTDFNTAKGTSFRTQYSYENTSSTRTKEDFDSVPTLANSSTGQTYTTLHLEPSVALSFGVQSPIGAKEDFLYIGAQFSGQDGPVQKEQATHQLGDLAPPENNKDTERFGPAQGCGELLLGGQEWILCYYEHKEGGSWSAWGQNGS